VTVTMTDNFGNIIPGYVGTLHFTSSDSQAVLPANYTFTAADQGSHTFQVAFKTTGSQSLNVNDTVNNALHATANLSVTTSAQILGLSGLGQNAATGAAQSITVTLTDNFGNVATGIFGDSFTFRAAMAKPCWRRTIPSPLPTRENTLSKSVSRLRARSR